MQHESDTAPRRVLVMDAPSLAPVRALAPPYAPETVAGWDALRHRAPTIAPGTLVVVDAAGPRGRVPGALWEVMTAHPSLSVVAALDVRRADGRVLARLVDRGVSDVLDVALDRTPARVARRLAGAAGRPFTRRVERALSRYASADARTLVRAAAGVAVHGGGADALAAAFGVRATTVAHWSSRASLPAPRTLQAWMRLLLAAMLLEEGPRTIAGVARAAGYATDRSLRRAMARFTGMDPRTLRRRGAFDEVAARFNAALSALRAG